MWKRQALPPAPDPARGDAYRAVRAHELMLNEATSRFEHAVLAPLTVINGGALVAFLALVGAVANKDSSLSAATTWIAVATTAWSLGLLASALATSFAFRKQRAINAAHRGLREELEQLIFAGDIDAVRALQGPPVCRARQRAQADRFSTRFEIAWWSGMLLFVLGAVSATIAIA